MAILGSTWRLLGRFGEHFGAIWANTLTIEKHKKNKGFQRFFENWGVKASSFGATWFYVGPSRRHLGATWPENGGQERQDEPKNRNHVFDSVFLTLRCTECDRGR